MDIDASNCRPVGDQSTHHPTVNTGEGEASRYQIKQLLEQIIKDCHVLSVAQTEKTELVNLSRSLIHRLDDLTLTPHSGYDVLKSRLTEIQGLLKEWLTYNYVKRLRKRRAIVTGIVEYVGKINSIAWSSTVLPTYPPSVQNLELPPHLPESPESHSQEHSPPPPVKVLNEEVTRDDSIPYAEGMYCEVWVGRWERVDGGVVGRDKVNREKVALKTLRILRPPENAARARGRLEHQLPHWAKLNHQNVLPFYGIVTNMGTRLYMVFPWREHGSLLDYVKANRQADKGYLLRGSAAGLSYLHSSCLVHGNVKCSNVLISPDGEPQICDFEMPNVIEEDREATVSKSSGGTFSLISSDVYSFAMLILECITEERPFSNTHRDAAVIHMRISKRQSPARPHGEHSVPEDLWKLMNYCWTFDPQRRPSMKDVLLFFLRA